MPTPVLHVRESPIAPIHHGRYIADHIEGARFVELPGADLGMTSTLYSVADEMAEFLTGERPPIAIEQILTTVLFTDIVDSTKRAASLGDERWLSMLDVHDRVMREQLRRFHGKEIKTTGDGLWRRSMVLRGPSSARVRWPRQPRTWRSRCGSDSTRGSATFARATWPDLQFTLPRTWELSQLPEKCSFLER